MQDKDLVSVMTIEDAARRRNDLAIAGACEFLGTAAAIRVVGELLNMTENSFDKLRGRDRILEGDVIRDCIQICKRRL